MPRNTRRSRRLFDAALCVRGKLGFSTDGLSQGGGSILHALAVVTLVLFNHSIQVSPCKVPYEGGGPPGEPGKGLHCSVSLRLKSKQMLLLMGRQSRSGMAGSL